MPLRFDLRPPFCVYLRPDTCARFEHQVNALVESYQGRRCRRCWSSISADLKTKEPICFYRGFWPFPPRTHYLGTSSVVVATRFFCAKPRTNINEPGVLYFSL